MVALAGLAVLVLLVSWLVRQVVPLTPRTPVHAGRFVAPDDDEAFLRGLSEREAERRRRLGKAGPEDEPGDPAEQ